MQRLEKDRTELSFETNQEHKKISEEKTQWILTPLKLQKKQSQMNGSNTVDPFSKECRGP